MADAEAVELLEITVLLALLLMAVDELLDNMALLASLLMLLLDSLLVVLLLLEDDVTPQKSPHKLSTQFGLSINGLRFPCHS